MYCVYCKTIKKETKPWIETGESVCFSCRISLLEQEFKAYLKSTGKQETVIDVDFF